jgi:hypothetical protein
MTIQPPLSLNANRISGAERHHRAPAAARASSGFVNGFVNGAVGSGVFSLDLILRISESCK